MTLPTFWQMARIKKAWFVGLVTIFVSLAVIFYARTKDSFVTEAIITAKASEDRKFNSGTLSGLAALAGAGQRPTFEQLGFLVQSTEVLEDAALKFQRKHPDVAQDMIKHSPVRKITLALEQGAREIFGKSLILDNPNERLVESLRNSIKISKTPEGFLQIMFKNGDETGQTEFMNDVLTKADSLIRDREQLEYQTRIRSYQSLVDAQNRTSDKEVLVGLIGREYSSFVSAQAGRTFSFEYIDRPTQPKRLYSISLAVLIIFSIMLSALCYLLAIYLLSWRNRT